MPELAELRREHRSLSTLVASLALADDAGPREAERARQGVIRFAQQVSEHFAHEDPVLAELLAAAIGSAVRAAGEVRQREARSLAEGCVSFAHHWSVPGAIERDPRTFASALAVLQAALLRLVQREEGEVYPLASQGWNPQPVLAPPMTGIPGFDDGHIEFFGMIGALRAIVQAQAAEIDCVRITALASFAERHFIHEDAMMASSGYPGLEDHRQEHHRARSIFMGFRNDYLDGRPVEVVRVLAFLERWLASHIADADMRLVAHLRASGRLPA